jgi:hypothetical protein
VRALRLVYELLDLEPAPAALTVSPAGAWGGFE